MGSQRRHVKLEPQASASATGTSDATGQRERAACAGVTARNQGKDAQSRLERLTAHKSYQDEHATEWQRRPRPLTRAGRRVLRRRHLLGDNLRHPHLANMVGWLFSDVGEQVECDGLTLRRHNSCGDPGTERRQMLP